MQIGEIIKVKRKEQNLTQEMIATFLGVTTPAVNKWENGVSYPDITLLPPLARLLKTDLNNLLSFKEDLSSMEMTSLISTVNTKLNSEGFEQAFEYASEIIHEYPSCDAFTNMSTSYLYAAINIAPPDKKDSYMDAIIKLFEKTSVNDSPIISDFAKSMLINIYIEKKDYDKAKEVLLNIPDSIIDKNLLMGNIHIKEKDYKDAAILFESNLILLVTKMQNTLLKMIEIALKENNMNDTETYVNAYENITKEYFNSEYSGYLAQLERGICLKDINACIDILSIIVSTDMKDGSREQYVRHLEIDTIDVSPVLLKTNLFEEINLREDADFLKTDERYLALYKSIFEN